MILGVLDAPDAEAAGRRSLEVSVGVVVVKGRRDREGPANRGRLLRLRPACRQARTADRLLRLRVSWRLRSAHHELPLLRMTGTRSGLLPSSLLPLIMQSALIMRSQVDRA